VRDRAAHAAPELEAHLRQLGGLAGSGLARDHDDLVLADRVQQVLAPGAHRQLRGIAHRRNGRPPALDALCGGRELVDDSLDPPVIAPQRVEAPAQAVLVAQRQLAEAGAQVAHGGS
jgi:hypothetical protein